MVVVAVEMGERRVSGDIGFALYAYMLVCSTLSPASLLSGDDVISREKRSGSTVYS